MKSLVAIVRFSLFINAVGKRTVSMRALRINKDEWVQADLKSRKTLALGLLLDICESFFSWFQDLKNGKNLLFAVFSPCMPH